MLFKIVLAFFGSIFPALLFNIDRRKILLAGLCGAIGWTAYQSVLYFTGSPITASFLGSIAVGIYSETLARIIKTPAFGFLIPGIFPLVPGFKAYTTLRYIVENNLSEALNKGILTLAVAGSIGFGIMLSTAIFKIIFRNRRADSHKYKRNFS
ncbi:uncharacterized membrane protein YjjB (DUF3815 family) [Ruminiclostridium sufflavum DSM 19573]|uniref:Uncharacterized membrane protein YjjB (DUF3815 family) n=1 Tax=Ruminiclostridium sufflavum DSM 19573 TaxID=1121337 RepID=A0A318Y4N9_9FIRM|nr:threonine/serine exporter family protein [Ruminiclostridium sufflavum]PYG86991.1 uncharacterized membrane protein YjjB (DUF3815 family) [Ruminiclostridium sufflavum DSM 19573]